MYEENKEAGRHAIARAKEGIENLIQSLDFDVGISFEFYEIYKYVYGLLADVHQSNNVEKVMSALDHASELLESFWKAWAELASVTKEEPVKDEAPKIYAGLTYGRDGKAEEFVEGAMKGIEA